MSDEITTWCHVDVRYQNILYNKETKKPVIIDFDCLGESNIYSDFIPSAPASQRLTSRFLNILIDIHNENCQYQIDKEKVVAILKLGKLDEYARVAMIQKNDAKQFMEVLKNVNFIEECREPDEVLLEQSLTM